MHLPCLLGSRRVNVVTAIPRFGTLTGDGVFGSNLSNHPSPRHLGVLWKRHFISEPERSQEVVNRNNCLTALQDPTHNWLKQQSYSLSQKVSTCEHTSENHKWRQLITSELCCCRPNTLSEISTQHHVFFQVPLFLLILPPHDESQIPQSSLCIGFANTINLELSHMDLKSYLSIFKLSGDTWYLHPII